jgi:dihydropyrimidine dehydrogenase (NADP+)
MEEYNKDAWDEIVGRCEEVGVDGFEINFSCPHGMPERRMGVCLFDGVIVASGWS